MGKMDNFKIIYRILKILEKSLDYENFDNEMLSPESLDITRERRDALLKMLLDSGYIEGLKEIKAHKVGTTAPYPLARTVSVEPPPRTGRTPLDVSGSPFVYHQESII